MGYISDHTDIGLGLNAASPNQEAARIFLDWVASDEFATLYSNLLPGFYSLSNNPVTLDNEVASMAPRPCASSGASSCLSSHPPSASWPC